MYTFTYFWQKPFKLIDFKSGDRQDCTLVSPGTLISCLGIEQTVFRSIHHHVCELSYLIFIIHSYNILFSDVNIQFTVSVLLHSIHVFQSIFLYVSSQELFQI